MPHSHTHCFNGHFPGEPRLDGFLIDVLDLCDLRVRQTDRHPFNGLFPEQHGKLAPERLHQSGFL